MSRYSIKKAVVVFSALVLTLLALVTSADEPKPNPSVIANLMKWWPGDYNNKQQLADLRAAGKPIWRADDSGEGGHIEVESHYRKVDLPQIGEHVLYVEELKHGDSNNIFRQRLYTLDLDAETNLVRVTLWYFNDKKKYIGAWKDLDRLKDITLEGLFESQDGCDLIVRPDGEKYHMKMEHRECAFGEKYFNYQVLLDADSFWFRDKINLLADDSIVSVAGDFTYHELERYQVEK